MYYFFCSTIYNKKIKNKKAKTKNYYQTNEGKREKKIKLKIKEIIKEIKEIMVTLETKICQIRLKEKEKNVREIIIIKEKICLII